MRYITKRVVSNPLFPDKFGREKGNHKRLAERVFRIQSKNNFGVWQDERCGLTQEMIFEEFFKANKKMPFVYDCEVYIQEL